jgi:hypothetical protein
MSRADGSVTRVDNQPIDDTYTQADDYLNCACAIKPFVLRPIEDWSIFGALAGCLDQCLGDVSFLLKTIRLARQSAAGRPCMQVQAICHVINHRPSVPSSACQENLKLVVNPVSRSLARPLMVFVQIKPD